MTQVNKIRSLESIEKMTLVNKKAINQTNKIVGLDW